GVSTPEHPPAGDLPRLIDDLEDGATGDALPAAALPDDTDRLPTRDLEADAVDRTHGAMIGLELSAQVLDLQERALDLRHGAPRQSSAPCPAHLRSRSSPVASHTAFPIRSTPRTAPSRRRLSRRLGRRRDRQ